MDTKILDLTDEPVDLMATLNLEANTRYWIENVGTGGFYRAISGAAPPAHRVGHSLRPGKGRLVRAYDVADGEAMWVWGNTRIAVSLGSYDGI